jgi:hypothetical protein
MNHLVSLPGDAGGLDWKSLIPLLGVLLTVVSTTIYGLNTTRRNLRANILGTSRLKLLDLLRDEVANLLIHGERIYSVRHSDEQNADDRDALAAVSKRLIVLLGREDPLRMSLAECVRRFADAPNEDLVEEIELLSQEVFRQQWDKVRTETGHRARAKQAQPRPGSAASDSSPPPSASP